MSQGERSVLGVHGCPLQLNLDSLTFRVVLSSARRNSHGRREGGAEPHLKAQGIGLHVNMVPQNSLSEDENDSWEFSHA